MNVTKDGFKDRQLHIEDYLQKVSAGQKEYAEVSAHQRIAEGNYTSTLSNLRETVFRKQLWLSPMQKCTRCTKAMPDKCKRWLRICGRYGFREIL